LPGGGSLKTIRAKEFIVRSINRFGAFILLVLAAAIASPWASAAPPEKEEKAKSGSFAVVQVDAEYQVVRKAELKDFQKGLNDKFTAAVKAHAEARKAAVKAKEKFTTPAPKRPKVKTLPKIFDTEEAASAYVQQLKDEDEKKKAAPTTRTATRPY
jgi:hypothetical protein